MEKRKLNRITAGFIVLVVMVLILMFSNSLRRSSHITLPEEGSSPGQTEDTNASGGDALTVIAVTPETVQTAIETLTRPRQYSRVIRVEQLWDGGSGSFETTVTVSGRWTRTDRSLSDTPSPTGRSLISGMAARAAFTAPLRGTSPRMTSRPSPPMRPSWTCRWRISPPRITAASPM